MVPALYDDVTMEYDVDGNLTKVTFWQSTNVVWCINLTYDLDGNFERAYVSAS
jgi:hypothetical protein